MSTKFYDEIAAEIKIRRDQYRRELSELQHAVERIAELDALIAAADAELSKFMTASEAKMSVTGRNRINPPEPVKEPRDEKPPADPVRG